MTIIERLAKLEEKVLGGFKSIEGKIDNHLHTHEKKETFQRRLIIAFVVIIAGFVIKLFIK